MKRVLGSLGCLVAFFQFSTFGQTQTVELGKDTIIQESVLFIPTAITPETQDKNAVWDIKGTENFPQLDVKVFNRWGSIVFQQRGSYVPWDGNMEGNPLPAGTYYYVIKLSNTDKPMVGNVTTFR